MQNLFITAALFLSMFSFLAAEACAYSGGNGSSATPYQIATADDLLELAADTANYSKHFILTAPINLAGRGDNADGSFSTAVIARDTDNTSTSFTGTAFEGTFDGNGHTLSNLTINTNGVNNHHLGLFGMIRFSVVIKNLVLDNVTIIGTGNSYHVGGLCGKSYYWSTILNCSTSGSAAGGLYVGGLCGYNYGNITECRSSCTVQSTQLAGGLCGYNYSGARIDRCIATGDVTGSPNTIGAMCGENFYGTISHSYATGVTSSEFWAIRAFCSTNYGYLRKCYSTRVAICNRNWGVITDCYWDADVSAIETGNGGFPVSTADMMKASTFNGWNDGIWRITEGVSTPHLPWEAQPGMFITTGYPAAAYPGNGESVPFELSEPEHLVSMSRRPCDWDKHFILTANIDMSSTTDYLPAADFTGTLDGQGHVISNLTINGNVTKNLHQVALLGYIGDGGYVCNLGIENVTLTGQELVGGLCGMNRGGILENCYVTGSITDEIIADIAGGLCGYNYAEIVNCYAETEVVGDDFLGGLCGWSPGSISASFATGNVSGISYIGGLCGTNSGTVMNCYSRGDVTQRGYWPGKTGGLVGMNWNGIINCYSAGSVNGTEGDVGGICGTNWGSVSSITNCFWDIETQAGTITASVGANPHGGTITNVLSKTTSEMQTQSTFTDHGWNFGTPGGAPGVWVMPAAGYPQLVWQYNAVDMEEFAALAQHWQKSGCSGDEPCQKVDWFVDGVIDIRDLMQLAESWLGDNVAVFDPVNMNEFALLAAYWQMTGCGPHQPCSAADWYMDGVIDLYDLVQLAASWLSGEMQTVIVIPPFIGDDFETGGFTVLDWQFSGHSNWTIVSDTVYEGHFAAKSGGITDSQSSSIEFTIDTTGYETITFALKVSSEEYWDFLRFYIDGVQQGEWSGEVGWSEVTFPVSAGVHIFAWTYIKDFIFFDGSDCAWIDSIRIE